VLEFAATTCNGIDSKVIDSRSVDEGIRRRRQCLTCSTRFTTYERIQPKSIFIIKKDGRHEEFNREKLLAGVRKACEKRPLPTGAIDKFVDNIESDLYQLGKNEIASTTIGDKVIEKLQELDHIAYIRFASIYRDFTDITTMKEAVDQLCNIKNDIPPAAQLPLLSPAELDKIGKQKRKIK
jgi:transcriptional repressor NrdR